MNMNLTHLDDTVYDANMTVPDELQFLAGVRQRNLENRD
jgi:hypothetical protein